MTRGKRTTVCKRPVAFGGDHDVVKDRNAELAQERRERLVSLSRQTYTTPRQEVLARLAPLEPVRKPLAQPPQKPEPLVPVPSQATTDVVDRQTPTKREPRPAQAPSPGRGGPAHKYLQSLIKHCGESWGFKAVIEKPVLDGLGSVDVALERDGQSIACEISVGSDPSQELRNVEKCLTAGFQHVVVASSERKTLARVRDLVREALDEDNLKRVRFLTPEEALEFIGQFGAQAASTEQTVGGWKVRVRHKAVSPEEEKVRKKAIAKILMGRRGR